MARVDQWRDHGAVQVAPRRLAMQQEHWRTVARSLVDVVHAQWPGICCGDVEVVRFEGIALEANESGVRRTQYVHARNLRRQELRDRAREGFGRWSGRATAARRLWGSARFP